MGGTWLDESINAELRSVAAAAHAAVWHERLLSLFKAGAAKRRRVEDSFLLPEEACQGVQRIVGVGVQRIVG